MLDYAPSATLNPGSLVRLIFLTLLAVSVGSMLPTNETLAQREFTPNSAAVKSMVDRAMAVISKKGGNGENGTLYALALVETSKRYDGDVPKGHPLIQSACNDIVSGIDGGRLLKNTSMYHPCLALILLCEVDDQKYRGEIMKLLKSFEERQLEDGSFTYLGKHHYDTSQTQYVALAYYVARQHNLPVSIKSTEKMLEFFIRVQQKGTWLYDPTEKDYRISIHAASAGSVYLLGDLLQLQPRLKVDNSQLESLGFELPPSISLYIPPPPEVESDGSSDWSGSGPLVDIDKSKLKTSKSGANSTFERAFTINAPQWKYYYLYAFERYAYFRERAEGDVGGNAMNNWYDKGVKFLKSVQTPGGLFPAEKGLTIDAAVHSSLAVMFLVRSSEILSLPPAQSNLLGGAGLQSGAKYAELKGGRMESAEASKNLNDLLDSLGDDLTDDQLEILADSIKNAIAEFQSRPGNSRGKTRAFLKSLVTDRNYYKRLIAVKFLAGEQDLDSAPALIYAVGDPDVRVAVEAHNGLRLISRKIDSIPLPESPTLEDLQVAKELWTEWLLRLRPDAELLD